MMMARNTSPPAAHSDIVESELYDILQTVIEARGGLSAIHQILDGAKTMSEIRARFIQWQTHQRASKSQQMIGTTDESVERVNQSGQSVRRGSL